MKNPIKKETHTGLITFLAVASVTAGAFAFLYLTEKGKNARKGWKKKIKGIAKDAAVKAVSEKTKISKKVVKAVADHVVKD
jgi:hypothetical protein